MRHLGKTIKTYLGFSLFILLFVWIYSLTIPNGGTPPAKQGVLDLSSWSLREQGRVVLDGEWEVYENRLLEPEDFPQPPREVAYSVVPGTWKGKAEEGDRSRRGFATYRLKVLLKDADEVYGIKISSIRMAHRLYINGKLEGESGRPAVVPEEHLPGNTPYTAYFKPEAKEIEIILQVANYMYYTGGIVNSIQLGWSGEMSNLNGFLIGFDLAGALILATFGTYHLNLYFLRRREKIYLFSGMYMFSLVLIQVLYGEKIFQRLLPDFSFMIVYKALDFSQFLSAILSILFFCSINDRLLSRKKMLWIIAPLACCMAAIIVLPYSVYNEARAIPYLYLSTVPLYILGRMIYLYSTSEKGTAERKELFLFIVTVLSLQVFLVDGVLYSENVVLTNLRGKAAIVCFITLMNILLSLRYTHAYERTEVLTHQLTVSNQLKDEFLMHTSHEIKTPLHGIMNIASNLLSEDEHNLSAKQKQHLWLIKDTSLKLSMLMHDLIDVTRLKHDELRLQMTVVDVHTVTRIVFDVLQFELASRAVKLVNDVPVNLWVQADENRIRQVMYNLVHNAIKHTAQGEIAVSAEERGGAVHVFVKDTGTGIPEDRHAKIFEFFEHRDREVSEEGYAGMGVGLYISRKLVERMEGELQVDWSEVGQGTSMTFMLQAAAKQQDDSGVDLRRSREAMPPDSLDSMEQHDHTILIVDDEASNIYTLLHILKRHRYNVLVAFSASEALVKMKEQPHIDLVVLDVMMPGLSGIELCRMLRVQYSILDLPILFATAKDTPQDIALGFSAGANDYLTKPFDAETLIARIRTLIAVKTSLREAIRNELAFYQAQIKPHFLYNALSSVISFCYTDGEKAAYLLSKLSQYLRYILNTDRHDLYVPLHQELDLIEAYVEIEKARFGERFDFVCEVDEHLLSCEIPSLCVQPFVENAIRHGLFEKEGYGTVKLRIREISRFVQITIQDDGVGMPEKLLRQNTGGSGDRHIGGIGISNIRRRLESVEDAVMIVDSEPGYGTTVNLYLPLQAAPKLR